MITSADQWDTARWYNFSATEFVCSHCNALSISPIVLDFLQSYRTQTGKSVAITSAYRCPSLNDAVSNTGKDGPHTTGFAVDISTNSQTQYELLRFALHYNPRPLGIGIAKTFTHLDWCDADVNEKYLVRPNVWRYA